jgi:hypothetical protein
VILRLDESISSLPHIVNLFNKAIQQDQISNQETAITTVNSSSIIKSEDHIRTIALNYRGASKLLERIFSSVGARFDSLMLSLLDSSAQRKVFNFCKFV